MKVSYGVFRVIRRVIKWVYPKTEILGTEQLPQEPCVIVANHTQMNGPIIAELYFPGPRKIWCAQEMMVLREVPAYAYRDFWSRKPLWSKWFYKLLSYIIAPFSMCLFNHAQTIPVYRDKRMLETFRRSLNSLKNGENLIIFPEHDAPHNSILCDFQEGFVDLARAYHKQTGKCLQFVPMYLAPALHAGYLGQPVAYDPESSVKSERRRICDLLMEQITQMAVKLPRHRVVPYSNIPKKDYVYNIPQEASHEKTSG